MLEGLKGDLDYVRPSFRCKGTSLPFLLQGCHTCTSAQLRQVRIRLSPGTTPHKKLNFARTFLPVRLEVVDSVHLSTQTAVLEEC